MLHQEAARTQGPSALMKTKRVLRACNRGTAALRSLSAETKISRWFLHPAPLRSQTNPVAQRSPYPSAIFDSHVPAILPPSITCLAVKDRSILTTELPRTGSHTAESGTHSRSSCRSISSSEVHVHDDAELTELHWAARTTQAQEGRTCTSIRPSQIQELAPSGPISACFSLYAAARHGTVKLPCLQHLDEHPRSHATRKHQDTGFKPLGTSLPLHRCTATSLIGMSRIRAVAPLLGCLRALCKKPQVSRQQISPFLPPDHKPWASRRGARPICHCRHDPEARSYRSLPELSFVHVHGCGHVTQRLSSLPL